MTMRTIRLTSVILPLAIGLAALATPAPAQGPGPAPVRMGMPASMFRDVNPVIFAGPGSTFLRTW